MTELEALGMVCDRLVGGMMFHSDHADLMRMLGMTCLHKLHEHGYKSDARSLRKVRCACVRHLGMLPTQGHQSRGEDLDCIRGTHRSDIGPSMAQKLLKASLHAWRDWETGTAEVFYDASCALGGAGLWDLVRMLQSGAEDEASEACDLIREMDSCCWDMCHAHELRR